MKHLAIHNNLRSQSDATIRFWKRRCRILRLSRKPMRRFTEIVLAMLAACPVWAPVWSQDQVPTFRSTTELVLVDVQVVHKKMKTPAPPLQQGNFTVYEDGQLQEIRSFSRDQLP